MTCSKVLRLEGKPYPLTCIVHGLGPCPDPEPAPNPTPKPISSINFEYNEETNKWVVKAVNMNESEVKDAFMAVLYTCQQIKPEDQVHCDITPTDTPHCYTIRPAIVYKSSELN